MDVRILGPLEVWVAGRPLALGGTKQRAVLAMLVVGVVVGTMPDASFCVSCAGMLSAPLEEVFPGQSAQPAVEITGDRCLVHPDTRRRVEVTSRAARTRSQTPTTTSQT